MAADLVERFGIAVRQLREQRGWSQEHLAARSGLNRSYVGEIERGQVIVSILTVQKLGSALQLDAADLLLHSAQIARQRQARSLQLASLGS